MPAKQESGPADVFRWAVLIMPPVLAPMPRFVSNSRCRCRSPSPLMCVAERSIRPIHCSIFWQISSPALLMKLGLSSMVNSVTGRASEKIRGSVTLRVIWCICGKCFTHSNREEMLPQMRLSRHRVTSRAAMGRFTGRSPRKSWRGRRWLTGFMKPRMTPF